MGLLNLFSREARETANSKREYEEWRQARKAKLHSFRTNAVQQIISKFPDANMLLNTLDHKFMVVLKDQGKLVVGNFADHYYPKLKYMPDTASIMDRTVAIKEFLDEVKLCQGTISKEKASRLERVRPYLSPSSVDSFQSYGFAITGQTELECLFGGAIFLGKNCIAHTSRLYPRPLGYLSERIFDEILRSTDSRPNIQSLVFVTADSYGGGQKMTYEILFDRSIHFDRVIRNDFLEQVGNLREFLFAIEPHFKDVTPWDPSFDADYWQTAIMHLKSPDPNEDRSADSYYLL